MTLVLVASKHLDNSYGASPENSFQGLEQPLVMWDTVFKDSIF